MTDVGCAGILRGRDMAETLRFAAAMGASVTTAGVFTPEQAQAFIDEHTLDVTHRTLDE